MGNHMCACFGAQDRAAREARSRLLHELSSCAIEDVALMNASREGLTEEVRQQMDKGANVNAQDTVCGA